MDYALKYRKYEQVDLFPKMKAEIIQPAANIRQMEPVVANASCPICHGRGTDGFNKPCRKCRKL